MAEPVPVAEIPRAILEDMWVVHAAHRLPKDGILIPGSCFTEKKGSQPKGQPITGLAGWKATLHFALAGVAPDGEDHQFSDRRIAILIQLKHLLPQVVCMVPENVTVLGKISIPASSLLRMSSLPPEPGRKQ
jgi:hypothetical protein